MNDVLNDRWALIDLDGTVADYDAALKRHMRALQSPDEPPYGDRYTGGQEPPYVEARRKLIQRSPGFWRSLEKLPQGFEIVDLLRTLGFSLHVLTKGPTTTPSAWSEKVEWCREHLPDAIVTVTGEKAFVYGRILVDDYPPYFEKWLQVRPRGLVVCVAHPWNADYAPGGSKENPNVHRYDGTDKPELLVRLTRAFQRMAKESL
jgi:5'-nucleotidase